MAWFSSKVAVTFIDDDTGESFAVTEMPPADLPESFELDTTLHIGDEDWNVVDAQPTTRAEYAKTNSLTLRIRRIETMDPNNILFSLPSICDAIPAVNNKPLSGNEFVLTEDDWRQLELVSADLSREVDAEMEKIRLIHENATAGVGWREIHVRSKPDLPLVGDLQLPDLTKKLNLSDEPIGVTYHGAQTQIVDGFAFTIGGLTVYGVAPNGKVQAIAFNQCTDISPTSDSVERLKSLAQELNLDLVYWCRCARVGSDDSLFDSLLANVAT